MDVIEIQVFVNGARVISFDNLERTRVFKKSNKDLEKNIKPIIQSIRELEACSQGFKIGISNE